MKMTPSTALPRLYPRQEAALDMIVGYFLEHKRGPTFREVGTAMGIGSTNGVHDHLKALEKKGYIVWNRATSRGFVPVGLRLSYTSPSTNYVPPAPPVHPDSESVGSAEIQSFFA
jgi:repressor LexA